MVLKEPDKYQIGKTFVYFVRHGDIDKDDLQRDKYGSANPILSAKGKKQAKEVALKFSKIRGEIDVFYSSTMHRAVETAKEISKIIKKSPKKYDELGEFNTIVLKRKFYHYKFWKHYRRHRMSLKIFDKILEKNKGKVIVIVAHGNIIRGIIGKKLGLSLKQIDKFDYHNCHISLVRFLGKKLDYIHYFNSKELV